ncbi:MAG: AAA family ATPase [Bacteroidia bacterium]|nr:AAA family ATPase [Bacteroidia bacterium]
MHPVVLDIPALSLVLLAGASSAGKTTFARRHFAPEEVISSDMCRALVSNSETNQQASRDAFEVLYLIVRKRLRRGLLTVVDATHVQAQDRAPLLAMAHRYHVAAVMILLDLPLDTVRERHTRRPDRHFEDYVLTRQYDQLQASLPQLSQEGLHTLYILRSPAEIDAAAVRRIPLPQHRQADTGPFDIIGDVHGCLPELLALLTRLGYTVTPDTLAVTPPPGRRAVFVGDLTDRGPDSPGVLRLVMQMVAAGTALCVAGNHDDKLARALSGHPVNISSGLELTLSQLRQTSPAFTEEVRVFMRGLPSHYVLDEGRLVVAHAGLRESMHGRDTPEVRKNCLYGETNGEKDAYGMPVRLDWAAGYRGQAWVIFGHTPVPEPVWKNRTLNLDTGCVFGGALTALQYPEMRLVSVPARQTYVMPKRPFLPQHLADTPE